MMLAYQPVRSLATLNIAIQQGLSGAKRVIPIIDNKNEINDKPNCFELKINQGNIIFKNVSFSYEKNENGVLDTINLDIPGKKMTSLVGHGGAGKSNNSKSDTKIL